MELHQVPIAYAYAYDQVPIAYAYAYDKVPIVYDLSKTLCMGLKTKVVCISRSSNFHHQGIPNNCKVSKILGLFVSVGRKASEHPHLPHLDNMGGNCSKANSSSTQYL